MCQNQYEIYRNLSRGNLPVTGGGGCDGESQGLPEAGLSLGNPWVSFATSKTPQSWCSALLVKNYE